MANRHIAHERKTLCAISRITTAALAAAIIASAPGCKSAAKQTAPAAKKPAPDLVAFIKASPATGEASVWAADASGANVRKLFDFEINSAAATTAPARFVYAASAGNIYSAFGREIMSYSISGKTGRKLAAISTTAAGAEHLWLSRDANALLVLCSPPPAEGASAAQEYILINANTGAQKKISPSDKDWDRFGFYNKLDYCYVNCEGKTYKSRADASFKLETGKGAGARHWPALTIKLKSGKTLKITDGSKRVLAARWTSSGAALVFIAADRCAETSCEGILHFVNSATGEIVPLSSSAAPPETIFNISAKRDAIYYDEAPVQSAVMAGVYSFNFVSKPKLISAEARAIALLEGK